MRIGINAAILDNKPTGLGIFTENIIKELSKIVSEQDEIIVYTSVPELFKGFPVTLKKVTHWTQPKYGKKAGIIRFLWLQLIFPFLVNKDYCDIVYSTTHHGNMLISKKQVLTIHDLLAVKFPNQYKLQYKYFKFILPKLLNKSPLLFTVSQNTKKDIVNVYGYNANKIQVIYNSINRKHFMRHENNMYRKKYGEYLLIIGASYPHKNVDRAIRVFIDYMQQNEKGCNLLIVNKKNTYLEAVMAKFKGNTIFDKHVKYLDYVPYNELPSLYSDAKALLYLSLYEGFGIPPLEAMACGCPVIASNNSSIPEVCGDAAIYIDPLNEDSIMNGIQRIMNDDDGLLRNKLLKRGYEHARSFSWEKSAEILYSTLKQLITNGH